MGAAKMSSSKRTTHRALATNQIRTKMYMRGLQIMNIYSCIYMSFIFSSCTNIYVILQLMINESHCIYKCVLWWWHITAHMCLVAFEYAAMWAFSHNVKWTKDVLGGGLLVYIICRLMEAIFNASSSPHIMWKIYFIFLMANYYY